MNLLLILQLLQSQPDSLVNRTSIPFDTAGEYQIEFVMTANECEARLIHNYAIGHSSVKQVLATRDCTQDQPAEITIGENE